MAVIASQFAEIRGFTELKEATMQQMPLMDEVRVRLFSALLCHRVLRDCGMRSSVGSWIICPGPWHASCRGLLFLSDSLSLFPFQVKKDGFAKGYLGYTPYRAQLDKWVRLCL